MKMARRLYTIFKCLVFAGTMLLSFSLARDALLAPYSSIPDTVGVFDGLLDIPIFWGVILLNISIVLTELAAMRAASSARLVVIFIALSLAAIVAALGLLPDARSSREIFWAKWAYAQSDGTPAEAMCHTAFPGLARCGRTCLPAEAGFCELLFVGTRETIMLGGSHTCGVGLIRDPDKEASDSSLSMKIRLLLRDHKVEDVTQLSKSADFGIIKYCLR